MTRLAVVTGANRGIGRATALAFAMRGLAVAMLVRRLDDALETVRAVSAIGGRALAVRCDVASEQDVDRAASEVMAELGPPHIVVNNAGIVRRGPPVHETQASDWDAVIATNLRGPFLVSRAFLPSMIAQGSGRLIHVASVSATMGVAGAASYAASKWGLIGLSKSLAEELRGTGIQSVAVLPGSVDTDMLVGSGFPPAMAAEDVATFIVQTALDAPAAITGAALELFG